MPIPQKLIDKILLDYSKTKSVFKAAKRAGLGSSTVHRVLKANGVECDGLQLYRQRIRKLPAKDVLIAEYESGMSTNAIAEKYNCGQPSVIEALKKYGTKMRPRGNWERLIGLEEAQEIAKQYSDLGSQQAVAVLRGTNQVRISKALRMLGVHSGRMSGENHPSWKGGRGPAPGGYIGVFVPGEDPLRCMAANDGRVMEHRLVMARSIGRALLPHENVHHINGDKTDNRLSNLQLRFGKHGKGVAMICAKCGSHEITYKALD